VGDSKIDAPFPFFKGDPQRVYSGNLENWFLENRRDFPWRESPTPYRVWISEVMLQQTRASVVVSYFLRWMEKFPDVKTLYRAPKEEVIKAWEGLGYYSRARSIHFAASQIVEKFNGEIPDREEALSELKGFGPYTVGALLSFAFHKKAPAIDGNVLRVISRLFCIEDEISLKTTRKIIEEKVLSLLDSKTPWVTMEALIELGALVCTPKPRCDGCPLQKECLGSKLGKELDLPKKATREKSIPLFRSLFVIEWKGKVLLRKGSLGKIMADLYEFPYLEMKEKSLSFLKVRKGVRELVGVDGEMLHRLTPCTHTFTKYKSHLFPVWVEIDTQETLLGYEWVSISDIKKLPFSAGHRKVAIEIEKIHVHR